MGCCVSTSKPTPSASFTKSSRSPPSPSPPPPPPPPPPPHPLEETVKEVLSETPKVNPKPKPLIPNIEEEPKKITPLLANVKEEDETHFKKKPKIVVAEESSEISEICSIMSESVSTTTFNESRENEEEGEVRQRIDRSPARLKHRSFSGDLPGRRERVVPKSPARRTDPSPGRVRSVSGRERRGFVPDGKGRDYGESSGRRSQSPATRTDVGCSRQVLGRSPSVRKTGKSPGRVRSDLADKNRKVDEVKWPPTSNESLENPLVSLECFIFL